MIWQNAPDETGVPGCLAQPARTSQAADSDRSSASAATTMRPLEPILTARPSSCLNQPARASHITDSDQCSAGTATMLSPSEPALTARPSSGGHQPAKVANAGQVHRISFPRFQQQTLNRAVLPPKRHLIPPAEAATSGSESNRPRSATPGVSTGPSPQLQQPSGIKRLSEMLISTHMGPQAQSEIPLSAASHEMDSAAHEMTPHMPAHETGCIKPEAGGSQDSSNPCRLPEHQSAQGQADAPLRVCHQQVHSACLTANEQLALRWRIGYKR